ncbi:MAG TPA: CHAT domain-containing protein [Sulfuriferula sp.]|nr:CHAT domain-containing protein [Sulfuriferula sp.]
MPTEPAANIRHVSISEAFPFIAIVFSNQDAPTVVVVTHVDDLGKVHAKLETILVSVLTQAKRTYEHWNTLPAILCMLQRGAEQYHIGAYAGSEYEPAAIARSVLMSLSYTFSLEVDGKSYQVTQFAPDPDSLLGEYGVRSADGEFSFKTRDHDPEAIRHMITVLVGTREVLDQNDRNMYAVEADMARKAGNALAAFRAYSHALRQHGAVPEEWLAAQGGLIAELLYKKVMYDYADWTAEQASALAQSIGRNDLAVTILRFGGIATSFLGDIDHTHRYFERACSLLGSDGASEHEGYVHMSYGLAILDLLAHWEAEGERVSANSGEFLQSMLSTAKTHLELARAKIGRETNARVLRNLAAIDLDLAREKDLSGDHRQAVAELDALLRSDVITNEPKLRVTAVFYRIVALTKLLSHQGDDVMKLLEEGVAAVNVLNSLENKASYLDRLCCLCVVISDLYLRADLVEMGVNERLPPGLLESITRNLELAYAIQSGLKGRTVRSPTPGSRYGGILVIDTVARLQLAYLLLAEGRQDASFVWAALGIADEAKGRFFKRDLAFAPSHIEEQLQPELQRVYGTAREDLVHGNVDPRLVLADYEWFLDHDLTPDQARQIREASDFAHGPTKDEILAWLPEKTGVLSLYASAYGTFIYLVVHGATGVEPALARVDTEFLVQTIAALRAGISGNEENDPIDHLHPERHDHFFQRLNTLKERMLGPLVPKMKGLRKLYISPHGLWHDVPVSALLLPLFWEQGDHPAIQHIPSIRAGMLLEQRAMDGEIGRRRGVGIASVPAHKNPVSAFSGAHHELMEVLTESDRPVSSAFGLEATRERVLKDMLEVGVQHILAHGFLESGAEVMQSGVLLATSSELPSLDANRVGSLTAATLMVNGTSADHVTIQACSLGRSRAVLGDELWGVTRALLAAGTNSVLAPIWDVHLGSSTFLMRRFYRNWLVDKQPKALAFAEAQRSMWSGELGERWRHFYHWGAFQLVGC